MGPEAKVEAYLAREVKALGGLCFKLLPSVTGLPDRLVVLPGGRVFLVELKSATGRLRERQKVIGIRLAARGVQVPVLHSTDDVDAWLESLDSV